MTEQWKDIQGYEGLYQVSNMGKIKALRRRVDTGKCHREWGEHFLSYGVDDSGYFRTNLAKDGANKTVKVHRLVAEAFIPNPDNKPTVNHKDGNKQNNSVENLEWATMSEQLHHAHKVGLKSTAGEKNPMHKLSKEDVEWIRNNYIPRHKEYGAVALARKFNVHRKTISRINVGSYWK